MYLLARKLIFNSVHFSVFTCNLEPEGGINSGPKPLFNSRNVDASCAFVFDTQYFQFDVALHHVPTLLLVVVSSFQLAFVVQ